MFPAPVQSSAAVTGHTADHCCKIHQTLARDPLHQCTICSFCARISDCFVIYIKKKSSEDPNDGDLRLLRSDVSSGGFSTALECRCAKCALGKESWRCQEHTAQSRVINTFGWFFITTRWLNKLVCASFLFNSGELLSQSLQCLSADLSRVSTVKWPRGQYGHMGLLYSLDYFIYFFSLSRTVWS